MTKIFLGGFPLDANELELVQLVSLYGDVDTIKIVRDKQTRKCKGYAFLEMKSLEAAEAVIEALNGATMRDRELSVSIAPDKPAAKPMRRPQGNFTRIRRPGDDDRPRNFDRPRNDNPSDDRPRRPRR